MNTPELHSKIRKAGASPIKQRISLKVSDSPDQRVGTDVVVLRKNPKTGQVDLASYLEDKDTLLPDFLSTTRLQAILDGVGKHFQSGIANTQLQSSGPHEWKLIVNLVNGEQKVIRLESKPSVFSTPDVQYEGVFIDWQDPSRDLGEVLEICREKIGTLGVFPPDFHEGEIPWNF